MMLKNIEWLDIELRGNRQYARAQEFERSDKERFKIQHLPVGRQLFLRTDNTLVAYWVQTGTLPEDATIILTEWYIRHVCHNLLCEQPGGCKGHSRTVTYAIGGTADGILWRHLRKSPSVKMCMLSYEGVQLALKRRMW